MASADNCAVQCNSSSLAIFHCRRRKMAASPVAKVRQQNQLIRLFLFLLQMFASTNAILRNWPSLEAVQSRFPGCCTTLGSFDCGDGVCLSVSHFHDGIADCADGSDEYCFPEQISCGTFCAAFVHLGECLRSPNCSQSVAPSSPSPSPISPPLFCPLLKKRLCGLSNTLSCRGYGECIFDKWLKDGKKDCLDGSDEDDQYANLFFNSASARLDHRRTVLPLPLPPLPLTLPLPPPFHPPLPPSPLPLPPPPVPSPLPPPPITLSLPPTLPPPLPTSTLPPPFSKVAYFSGLTLLPPFVSASFPISSPTILSNREAENAELDHFGAEFARSLMPPFFVGGLPPSSSSTASPSANLPHYETVFGEQKSVEQQQWILFPNWPISATTKFIFRNGATEGQGRESAVIGTKEDQWKWKENQGKGEEKGRANGEEEQGQPKWIMPMPMPFQQSEKEVTNIGKTAGATVVGGARMTTTGEVWEPEGTVKGVGTKEEAMGRERTEGKAKETQMEEGQRGAAEAEGTTTEATRDTASQTDTTASPVPTTLLTAQSVPSPHPLPSSLPSLSSPFFSSAPSSPLVPLRRWDFPISSADIANASEKLGGLSCTERVNRIAKEFESVPVRCQCPAGQFKTSDGSCAVATVSTFRAKIGSLCGHNFADFSPSSSPSSSLQEQLIILKLIDSLPDWPFCVRNTVNNGQIVVNTICADECAIEMLENAAKSRGNLPEVNAKVSELTDGACHRFDLNDCDDKAQCLQEGLRFQCRCLPGTKDTSTEGQGHRCEGTVILQTCTKLLGVCLIVWLIMLLLFCFLLPIISLLCLKYCFNIDSIRLRHILMNLMHKMKGRPEQPKLVPIIRTSQIGEEQMKIRRESVKLPGQTLRDETVTLKVPTMTNGTRQGTTRLMPSDSEEYLIMEEDEGEEQKGKDTVRGGETVREKEMDEGVEREEILPGKQTVRQLTEKSTKSTMPSSTETEVAIMPGAKHGSFASSDAMTMKSEEAVEETTEVEVHEQDEGEEEEEKNGAEREALEEREEERPKSAASRTGSPTIWDQYKILGDQFAKYGSLEIEKRKGSVTESMDELLRKREGAGERVMKHVITSRETREKGWPKEIVEEKERAEEYGETDQEKQRKTELGKRGEKMDTEEEEETKREEKTKEKEEGKEREQEGKQREPGRAIPADSVREGALNIGFVMPSQIGAPSSKKERFGAIERGPAPPLKRRAFGNGRLFEKKPPLSVQILTKKPIKRTEFVVIKGGRGEAKEGEQQQKRGGNRSVMGQRKRDAFVKGQLKEAMAEDSERRRELAEDSERRRECRERLPPRVSEKERQMPTQVRKMTTEPPKMMPTVPVYFDPDLPSTSQSVHFWEKSLRHPFTPGGQLEEYARRRMDHFQRDGHSLRSIEEQMEERVHSGCITSRRPWNISPIPDPDLPASPLREMSEESLARKMGRQEERVHTGCITWRRPWDSSPHKEEGTTTVKQRLGGDEGLMESQKRRKTGRTVRIREDNERRRERPAIGEETEWKGKKDCNRKWLDYD